MLMQYINMSSNYFQNNNVIEEKLA